MLVSALLNQPLCQLFHTSTELHTTGGHQAAQEAGPGVGHVKHDEAGARPGADQGQHELGRDGLLRLLPIGQKGT